MPMIEWPKANLFERNRVFALIFMILASVLGWITWVLFVQDKDMAFGNFSNIFNREYVSPTQWWGLLLTVGITLLSYWQSCWVIT